MKQEIVNKVAKSPLITLDLEELYPKGKRLLFDLSDLLYEGLLLREKEFRADLKVYDWEQYRDAYVAIDCSSDAILPAWATLLVSVYLQPFTKKIVVGNLTDLETVIYSNLISTLDIELYRDKKVIIKGCSNKAIPELAYVQVIEKLRPVVNSLMYGEACSTVPLYKKKK